MGMRNQGTHRTRRRTWLQDESARRTTDIAAAIARHSRRRTLHLRDCQRRISYNAFSPRSPFNLPVPPAAHWRPSDVTVRSGSWLQPMKPKASTAKKIAAFRMPPYTRRPICSQLGCLVLALAVLTLPLAGIRFERAPILTPIATELVPLATSLQSPPSSPVDLPSLLAPARLVLGPLPSAVFGPNADSKGLIHNLTSFGFPDSRPIDIPNGRSPPSA